MEKQDEMTVQICNMLDDLMNRAMLRKVDGKSEAEADIYGFPFEPNHAISMEPLGFYESTLRLKTEANEMFRFIGKLNRHSPLYTKASSLMEKLTRQLGVCCITKAVLEQEGNDFELLDGLTISWLRRITAFNVRKCYSAFMEDREKNCFLSSVLDLSIRWTALDKRLIATEEKIEKIKAGKMKTDPTDNKTTLKDSGCIAPDSSACIHEDMDNMRSLTAARAFSADKSAAAEMLKKGSKEIPLDAVSILPRKSVHDTWAENELISTPDPEVYSKDIRPLNTPVWDAQQVQDCRTSADVCTASHWIFRSILDISCHRKDN